jgi:hypothetical protein
MSLATIESVATIAGAAVVVSGVIIAGRKPVKKFVDFMDDMSGEPARPGVPERPGVMVRLERIEMRVARIEDQVHPNHGSSMADAVHRIEQAVKYPPANV